MKMSRRKKIVNNILPTLSINLLMHNAIGINSVVCPWRDIFHTISPKQGSCSGTGEFLYNSTMTRPRQILGDRGYTSSFLDLPMCLRLCRMTVMLKNSDGLGAVSEIDVVAVSTEGLDFRETSR